MRGCIGSLVYHALTAGTNMQTHTRFQSVGPRDLSLYLIPSVSLGLCLSLRRSLSVSVSRSLDIFPFVFFFFISLLLPLIFVVFRNIFEIICSGVLQECSITSAGEHFLSSGMDV